MDADQLGKICLGIVRPLEMTLIGCFITAMLSQTLIPAKRFTLDPST